MDFVYSDEQVMLRDSVDRFGQDQWAPSNRRGVLAQGEEGARERWREMAELGWLMLPIAEADGGLGGSAVDVMALAEAMGRHLIVSPFVTSCVLVPALASGSGAAGELLAGIAAGETIAAAALADSADDPDPAYGETRAERDRDGWRLTGAKPHVEDGADAGWFVVSARTSGASGDRTGVALFLVAADAAGLTVERFRSIDAHRHAALVLDGVPAVALHEDALEIIEAALDRAVCAQLAEATGSMEAAAAETLGFLRTREQFGAPIGSFQALQHRMVDMTIACEEARSMTYHATLNFERNAVERARAVAAGKVRVGQSGLYVGQQAVQLHGGVGFSEELIVSHHLRRQMMLRLAFGSVDYHRARYAALPASASLAV